MKKNLIPFVMLFASIPTFAQSPDTEWGAIPYEQAYVFANGRLASPAYRSISGTITGEMDLRRTWINALIVDGAVLMGDNQQGVVDTAESANVYGRTTHLVNTGIGTLSGSTTRLRCENLYAGYCIGQKITVSCAKPASWGCWGYQEGIGEGVDTWRRIGADRGIPVSVPYVEIVADDLAVTQAVIQWNVGQGSTGDFLRIVGPNGIVFRVTSDGKIVTGSGRVIE